MSKSLCLCIVKNYCIAQYDYEATATNQISLREGDGIIIISKAGEATGWWKGNNNGKVKSYIVTHQLVQVKIKEYRTQ